VRTKSLNSEQMEARVARFNKLQTYQRQNFETHNIPPGAVEKVAARRVYPVMAPADYQGRSAGAPVKGPRGLIVSIAECEPGNGPGLHRHLNTVENFCCLSGRFEIAWGDQGEHTLVLEPLDMISVPRGENRSFRNISNELGRLLVMIVPETDEQVEPSPMHRACLGRVLINRWLPQTTCALCRRLRRFSAALATTRGDQRTPQSDRVSPRRQWGRVWIL
jgi:uncharacterized RmlC-like cupin family protein